MNGYVVVKNEITMLHIGVFLDREVADVVMETLAGVDPDNRYGLYPVVIHERVLTE